MYIMQRVLALTKHHHHALCRCRKTPSPNFL